MARRRFLRRSALAGGAALILPSGWLRGVDTPSNRIAVGLIGPGNRGWVHLNDLLQRQTRKQGVEVVAVSDVDRAHRYHGRGKKAKVADRGLDPAVAEVGKRTGKTGCGSHADFRQLCGRDDVDAVVVATPDHSHAVICLEALARSRHVYCEKPVTHTFREGQQVRAAAGRAGVAFQVGSQQRSDLRFRRAAEIVRNGLLGKIQRIEIDIPTGHSEPPWPIEIEAPPETLDYDAWCGPAERLPFHESRTHWGWRCHSAFGGGTLMDFIGHHHDIVHWSLGEDGGGPDWVEAVGWTPTPYPHWNAPVDLEVRAGYTGGIEVSMSNRKAWKGGPKWIGEDGWLQVRRGGFEASNRDWLRDDFDRGPVKLQESTNHMGNWLAAVRGDEECLCPPDIGHRSITPGHLAWVSYRIGHRLRWNPQTECVVGDSGADMLLKR